MYIPVLNQNQNLEDRGTELEPNLNLRVYRQMHGYVIPTVGHEYGYMWVWVGVCPPDTPAHTHIPGVGMGWGISWGMSFTNEFKIAMALFKISTK